METRKLASVQVIRNLEPIPNADFIEKAKILGWDVVVKKGEFQEGDFCVYFEIDSLLPDVPEFNFINRETKDKGGGLRKDKARRLRTKKIKKVLAQGLAMPMAIAEEAPGPRPSGWHLPLFEAGQDVTEAMGVTRYEPPETVAMLRTSNAKGLFPACVPKTDEIRVQSIPEIFDKIFPNEKFYVTVKLDGTSGTFIYRGGEFDVCSRNRSLKDAVAGGASKKESFYWAMAKKYDIQVKLGKLGLNIAIQGEICGPGIQKNKLGLPAVDLFLFDVYFVDKQRYGSLAELKKLASWLKIPMVPILQEDFAFSEKDLAVKEIAKERLLNLAEGKYSGTKNEREGIIVRLVEQTIGDCLGERLSFKVISNRFLLKSKA